MSETLDLVKMLISFRKLNGLDVSAELRHLGIGTVGGGIFFTMTELLPPDPLLGWVYECTCSNLGSARLHVLAVCLAMS